MALTKEERKRRAELLARGLKVCSKCGRVLPIEQFSKDKNRKDGLYGRCKKCGKQYNQENKEKKQQYNKQYYQENKEQRLQYQNQYYQDNSEKRQQYDKQYYQEHKLEKQQHQQQYNQTPQGQIVRFNGYAKRRKREEAQGNGITKEQWLEMMQFFDWKCAYSGVSLSIKKNRSIDHIIPLVKGGEHEVWNCVPMDKRLNKSKQDKDIMEWYTAQDFYSKERLDKILAWQQYAYNKWSNTEEAQ